MISNVEYLFFICNEKTGSNEFGAVRCYIFTRDKAGRKGLYESLDSKLDKTVK
jgi:hypothetical protein